MTHYGFNFLWMYVSDDGRQPQPTDEKALDFLAAEGFNFVRLPANYRTWTKDFDYFHPNESILTSIDGYLDACRTRGFQMSLNLHRAPGYCINNNDLEKHNLWLDPIAQEAFVFQWEMFARRYQGIPSEFLSFDLVNEPPSVGQYGLTRENHAALIRRVVAAIRAIDPAREVVIDGLGGGHLAMPELADLGVVHSGRGYQPMPVSHHRASWWDGHQTAPEPKYPGVLWDGKVWDRDTLREFYQPWRDVEAAGANVHIGECGCYNKTPNDIALRWLGDLFGLYKEFSWGLRPLELRRRLRHRQPWPSRRKVRDAAWLQRRPRPARHLAAKPCVYSVSDVAAIARRQTAKQARQCRPNGPTKLHAVPCPNHVVAVPSPVP